jgi:hypothetical protein
VLTVAGHLQTEANPKSPTRLVIELHGLQITKESICELPHNYRLGVFYLLFRVEFALIARMSAVWAMARSSPLYACTRSDFEIPLAIVLGALPAKVAVFVA